MNEAGWMDLYTQTAKRANDARVRADEMILSILAEEETNQIFGRRVKIAVTWLDPPPVFGDSVDVKTWAAEQLAASRARRP